MPTLDRSLALDVDGAAATVARSVTATSDAVDGIGLELELFPVADRGTTRRVGLEPPGADGLALRPLLHPYLAADRPARALPGGALLSVEPGGQLEISTECQPTVDAVLEQADGSIRTVVSLLADHGVALAASGMDLWHDVASAPQQLTDARYPAMAAYLAARGPAGALMMRHTCSLQITLDLGPPGPLRDERWLVANLLAPMATATFATSPSPDGTVRSRRSLVWQDLDPTRTGFPRLLLSAHGTVEEQLLRAALEADIMLVRTAIDPETGRATAAEPGRPGWRFLDWLRTGHPILGWPTEEDLRYHLTTLFHEVRVRGPMELRSLDAPPPAWRTVPVVLYAGALLDGVARGRIREVLERHRARLPSLLRHAARAGVSDPGLCAMAVEVWSFALEGAGRLAGVDPAKLAVAERYLDRYTLRGRCPADELAERMRTDPSRALRWVTEPAPATMERPR